MENDNDEYSLKSKEKNNYKDFELELANIKHKFRMEELAYIRETENIKHDLELQRQRIKSADIRRNKEMIGKW